jgi:3D (Asp-Asp-Asp) domain-containing protein
MSTQSSSSEDGSLNIAFFSVLIVSLFLLFIFSEGEALPKEGEKEMAVLSSVEEILQEDLETNDIALYNETAVLAQSTPTYHKPRVLASQKPVENFERRWVRLTAYAPLDPNAQEGMCFSGNPMITASGTYVREGIVAANFLSFGTKIRIPSLFGDRVFTVEDRMSSRYTNTVDVLVSSKQEAMSFGIKRAYIEILK